MPSLDFLLSIVLLQGFYASSVAQNSGLNSYGLVDSSADFAGASIDPVPFLDDTTEYDSDLGSPSVSVTGADPMEFELDAEPLTGLGVTSLNSNDPLTAANFDPIGTDSYCSNQSRKRNDAICPTLEIPTRLETNDDDLDTEFDAETSPTAGNKKNPECEERIFGFGRIFDVCCNGRLGPFAIDYRTRLVYNWIGDCRPGMPSMVSIRFVLLMAIDRRRRAPVHYGTIQRLLSVLVGEWYFEVPAFLTDM